MKGDGFSSNFEGPQDCLGVLRKHSQCSPLEKQKYPRVIEQGDVLKAVLASNKLGSAHRF